MKLIYRFGDNVWHYLEIPGATRQVEFLSRSGMSAAGKLAMQQALVNAGYTVSIHGSVRTYTKEM